MEHRLMTAGVADLVACLAARTRIKNGLSRMGLSDEDKLIAHSRLSMIATAQSCYADIPKQAA